MAVFGSLGLLAVTAGLGILLFFRGWLEPDGEKSPSQFAYSLEHPGQIVLEPGDPLARPRRQSCHHYNCFNAYKCGSELNKILVYIYPADQYLLTDGRDVAPLSREYVELLETIRSSDHYTANPDEACVFVPTVDLLNLNRVNMRGVGQALARLDMWDKGHNHILFNMLPGHADHELLIPSDSALVASTGFTTLNYRPGFDISLPMYNPTYKYPKFSRRKSSDWFILSAENKLRSDLRKVLKKLERTNSGDNYTNKLAVLEKCKHTHSTKRSDRCSSNKRFTYPEVLKNATFCLVTGGPFHSHSLIDSLYHGCIPVILADMYVLPFSEVLDWKKFSFRFHEHDLPSVPSYLSQVSRQRISEMQHQLRHVFQSHFSSIRAITETSLSILNSRIYPQNIKTHADWNKVPDVSVPSNPLFLPTLPPADHGFTAVILTYNRLDSLFLVITKVADVPSLARIVVIWNNQYTPPPPVDQWPRINKPLKIIQTEANLLTNRFYPYEEIETEAVLSMDDDITMLTVDELEFGYQVWREFPDRVVGFPSRSHVWDNVSLSWRYESEWTNDVSMVLTGVAFYHKYWHYLYTAAPSPPAKRIKAWVDTHMNCEDIAMNFLVSNATGKPPIKVAPRKKFKCSSASCENQQMSSDQGHLVERSTCINMLVEMFGYMPLKSVEFRADPVLYKDAFAEQLKLYSDIGSL